MIGGTRSVMVPRPFDDVRAAVSQRLQQTMARVLHAVELCDTPGRRAAVAVAVSRPLRGSRALAVAMQGARYTMVYVELREAGHATRITVAAGGGETWTGFDFGRNADLIDLVLRGLAPNA